VLEPEKEQSVLLDNGFPGYYSVDCPACEQTIPDHLLVEARTGQGRTFRCPTLGCTETFHVIRRGQNRFDLRFL
jgi:hypothetical protein